MFSTVDETASAMRTFISGSHVDPWDHPIVQLLRSQNEVYTVCLFNQPKFSSLCQYSVFDNIKI